MISLRVKSRAVWARAPCSSVSRKSMRQLYRWWYAASMGERLGAWRLDALIAVGGIGEVWRASGPGGVAAVKRMHTHLLRHDEARELFAIEQKLAMTLPHHPNVVHGLEAGEVEGRPCIARARAAGADLRGRVAAVRHAGVLAPVVRPRPRALAIAIAACGPAG